MVSYLDCIYRIPSIIEDIVAKRKDRTNELVSKITDKHNEIIFVGSGTSNTCSVTSYLYVEKYSGLPTSTILPNQFMKKTVFNKNAIYIFTSQSGTSTFTQTCLKKAKEIGALTVAITEKEDTPLAKIADVHVNMGCGYEEYGMRTIGYCSAILTQMLIGLEIGLTRKAISETDYNAVIADALKVPASHKAICDKTLEWFDKNKEELMDADGFAYYGSGSLWGVAMEGALKALEVVKKYLCVGFEMDDGLHGPTMGYTKRHNIIILNDGVYDNKYSKGLKNYIVNEVGSAFIVGANTIDDKDLAFVPVGNDFRALEFAPVVEILAYRLANDQGVAIPTMEEMMKVGLPESKYFNTHDE